jgi:hypothetical protein
MKHRVIKKGFPRIVQTWNNGAKVYRVDCRKEGWSGQKRFDFCSEQVARAKAKEIEKIFLKQGVEGAKLTLADRIKVQSASVPLNEFNQSFGSAYSVGEAVHFFIRAMQEQKTKLLAPKVQDAVEQFLAAKFDPNGGKGNRQLSVKTLNELKSIGKIITESWGYKRVTEITTEQIKGYLNKTKTKSGAYFTNQTRLNRLTKIKQFFNYCIEKPREWLKEKLRWICLVPPVWVLVVYPPLEPGLIFYANTEAEQVAVCRRLRNRLKRLRPKEILKPSKNIWPMVRM